MSSADRRRFLEQASIATAAALTAGFTATAHGYAANETIRVACLGTGGRCQRLMQSLAQIQGVRIVGVCDVWEQHRGAAVKLADAKAVVTHEFRELLDRKDVDAVLIGSPDHWHVPMTIAACQAGKDVYVEKPLTHDPSEGESVIAAQNDNRRVVQVGMQQRSMPHIQKAREILKSGELGKIHKVHLTWNRNTPRGQQRKLGIDAATVDWKRFLGNAKEQPFDEYRFRNWRWFWDFGGGIFTDLMVHWIDVAHWLLDLGYPTTAVSIGDHLMAKDLWETPDTVQTLLQYPGGVQAYFEGTFVNARNAAMIEFMGDHATLYIDRGRYEIHPERNKKIEASQWVLGDGPRGADFYANPDGELLHVSNWIESIRSRETPRAPAEAGVLAAASAHLANRALRTGETARG